MKFSSVFKQFTPSFLGGVTSAILVSIIIGESPKNLPLKSLILWMFILYIVGIFFSWLVLISQEDD